MDDKSNMIWDNFFEKKQDRLRPVSKTVPGCVVLCNCISDLGGIVKLRDHEGICQNDTQPWWLGGRALAS